jgi:hypothetical protein
LKGRWVFNRDGRSRGEFAVAPCEDTGSAAALAAPTVAESWMNLRRGIPDFSFCWVRMMQ